MMPDAIDVLEQQAITILDAAVLEVQRITKLPPEEAKLVCIAFLAEHHPLVKHFVALKLEEERMLISLRCLTGLEPARIRQIATDTQRPLKQLYHLAAVGVDIEQLIKSE